MKKLALFDIDGVVYDGHLIFDVIHDEEKRGFITKGLWKKILVDLGKYKKGKKNYKETADSMLANYAFFLKGKKYSDLLEDNFKFIKAHRNKIFPYFFKLLPELSKSHDIFFITSNFQFSTEAFAKIFGLKNFISSKIEVISGIATGKVELSLGGNKGLVFSLIEKYGWKGSIAVGDSENDSDMLEKVDFPIVMEPNPKLVKIAKNRNWEIVNRGSITGMISKIVKRNN